MTQGTCRLSFAPTIARVAGVLVAATLVAGCATTEIPFIYRLSVQQGNVVDPEMLTQLQPGMDRRRVRFIMGTPLVEDPFNADRWDYYYSLREGTARRNQRVVTLLFEGDRLKRIVGDVRPGTGALASTTRPEQVVNVPPAEPEGFFAALTPGFLKSTEAKQRARAQERLRNAQAEREAREEGESEPEVASLEVEASTAVSTLSPAQANAESRYFTRLFSGYGRAPGAAAQEPAAAGSDTLGTDSADSGIVLGDAEAEADTEQTEETFFQRLARQFKENQENADPNRPPMEGGDR
ncbi:MAG: outer membrane protein assembly factor BamE [Gammaproteobacteria bacterium]